MLIACTIECRCIVGSPPTQFVLWQPSILNCQARSDIMSTFPDLTPFHVSKNASMRSLCSSQRSSSLASLKSVTLQDIDFEIKYLAGIRFVDTAKYHGSKLLRPSLSRFHT